MSKKYIEADALKNNINIWVIAREEVKRRMIDMIDDEPAADVRENVRGEWVECNGNIVFPFWERYECSECGARSDNTNFCPNCGADMRGEEHTMEEYMMGQEGNPDDGSL